MTCPECDSELGNPALGNIKCPQCKSDLLNSSEGLKPKIKPSLKVAGAVKGAVTHKFRKLGPSIEEPQRFFCVGCNQALNPALSRTGKILEGTRFSKVLTTEIHIPVIGTLETWERDYRLTGPAQQVQVSRTRGFLAYNKGFLCDSCAAITGTFEDRNGVAHPLVKLDGIEPGGFSRIPQVERIPGAMPSRAQEFNDSLIKHTQGPADNHWLNVGRKRS